MLLNPPLRQAAKRYALYFTRSDIKRGQLMFNNKWNKDHILFWKIPLELNSDGFTGFQTGLTNAVKTLLESNQINYTEEIEEVIDSLSDDYENVKLVTLTLTDHNDSKLWIYHDMAEYDINKKHHIFEEWGYLSPTDLQERYIKKLSEVLGIQ